MRLQRGMRCHQSPVGAGSWRSKTSRSWEQDVTSGSTLGSNLSGSLWSDWHVGCSTAPITDHILTSKISPPYTCILLTHAPRAAVGRGVCGAWSDPLSLLKTQVFLYTGRTATADKDEGCPSAIPRTVWTLATRDSARAMGTVPDTRNGQVFASWSTSQSVNNSYF